MSVSPATEWQPVWDSEHKRYYYFNARLQQSSWTDPDAAHVEA